MRWPWTTPFRRLFLPTRPVRRSRALVRPRLLPLEDRLAPATITVNTTLDTIAVDGLATLREAITSVNNQADVNADVTSSRVGGYASTTGGTPDVINFDIPAAGAQEISLTSALPSLSKKVTINGLSQTGATAGAPLIELNGAAAGANVDGLTLVAGSDASTVEGLVIQAFSRHGLVINGSNGNTVTSNFIGTTSAGSAKVANGGVGIVIEGAAHSNTVGGTATGSANVISGNAFGIDVSGAGSSANLIEGNVFGMDVTGSKTALGNTNADVVIQGGATANTVGGTTAAAANTIAATIVGVLIAEAGTGQNLVEGNFIGTDNTGTVQHGNSIGVVIGVGATTNTVGGTAAGSGNVISGNTYGVDLSDAGSNNNTVEGNLIGTDVTGAVKLPNQIGVVVGFAASSNALGAAGAGNTISGNAYGLVVAGAGTSSNVVAGNRVGTTKAGMAPLANTFLGVLIEAGAASNTVGGTMPAAANVIGGNGIGVLLDGASTTKNALEGNQIGTDTTGTVNLANSVAGVLLQNGAVANTVGGTASGAGNTVAFNGGFGVAVVGNTTTQDSILGNSIFGNGGLGIDLGADGPTANGTNPRTFPNDGQNFPTITGSGGNTVSGTLTSAPSTSFTLQYFGTPTGGPAGQGKTFLGSDTVTTDATGNATFTSTISSIPTGDAVTATATNQTNGDTSEFSS